MIRGSKYGNFELINDSMSSLMAVSNLYCQELFVEDGLGYRVVLD